MMASVADAWRLAYLKNRELGYANPIPSSLDVLAEMRRWEPSATREDICRESEILHLILVDVDPSKVTRPRRVP